jgi:hypothetical protein
METSLPPPEQVNFSFGFFIQLFLRTMVSEPGSNIGNRRTTYDFHTEKSTSAVPLFLRYSKELFLK